MYVAHVTRDCINAADLVVKIQCAKQTYAAAAAYRREQQATHVRGPARIKWRSRVQLGRAARFWDRRWRDLVGVDGLSAFERWVVYTFFGR